MECLEKPQRFWKYEEWLAGRFVIAHRDIRQRCQGVLASWRSIRALVLWTIEWTGWLRIGVPASRFSGAPRQVSKLQRLRDAKTPDDFARLLGSRPAASPMCFTRFRVWAKYKSFEVPKRSGGHRQIKAPQPVLALLQRRLANLLCDCLDELKKAVPARRSLAHGFERKRNIITNAVAA